MPIAALYLLSQILNSRLNFAKFSNAAIVLCFLHDFAVLKLHFAFPLYFCCRTGIRPKCSSSQTGTANSPITTSRSHVHSR
jgi:hypothetical protein